MLFFAAAVAFPACVWVCVSIVSFLLLLMVVLLVMPLLLLILFSYSPKYINIYGVWVIFCLLIFPFFSLSLSIFLYHARSLPFDPNHIFWCCFLFFDRWDFIRIDSLSNKKRDFCSSSQFHSIRMGNSRVCVLFSFSSSPRSMRHSFFFFNFICHDSKYSKFRFRCQNEKITKC